MPPYFEGECGLVCEVCECVVKVTRVSRLATVERVVYVSVACEFHGARGGTSEDDCEATHC